MFIRLLILSLLFVSCKTTKSDLTESVALQEGANGAIKNAMFYYLDPMNKSNVCAVHCRGEFTATSTGATILDVCSKRKDSVPVAITKANFTYNNFNKFVGPNTGYDPTLLKKTFGIVAAELGAVASTIVEKATAGKNGQREVLNKLYQFVSESDYKISVSGKHCNLKKAFESGEPSITYDRGRRKAKDGYYVSLNKKDGFYYESKPKYDWSNKIYRATEQTIATKMCENEQGMGLCVANGKQKIKLSPRAISYKSKTTQPTKTKGICLGPDTEIRMADGSAKKISEIRNGEKVLGYDTISKSVRATEVIALFIREQQQVVRLNLDNNESILATPSHLFYLEGAESGVQVNTFINTNESLTAVRGSSEITRVPIVSYEVIDAPQKVFNLFTDLKTYVLANGVVSVSYESGVIGPNL